LKPKERFLVALKNGIPDRVPLIDWLFSQRLFKDVLGVVPQGLSGDLLVRCGREIGHDAVWIPFGGYAGISNSEGVYRDEWGTTYQKDLSVSWPIDAPVDYPIQSPAEWATFNPPDPTRESRLDEIRKGLQEARGDLAIVGGVSGPFTTAWMLLGYERLCYWVYEHPALVREIFNLAVEYYTEAASRMIDTGVDAMMVAEDLGYRSGLFWPPDLYREHLFPYLQKVITSIKRRGLPVILHCDGNVNEIMPDLVDMNIDGLNPVERKASMDIKEVKRKWGSRISLIGNLDLVRVLPHGSREEVMAHVRDLIETVGMDGGYIVASDHSLNHQIPIDNILAIRDAVRQYGVYGEAKSSLS
jgi:uroporphyrinogen decarboxylase